MSPPSRLTQSPRPLHANYHAPLDLQGIESFAVPTLIGTAQESTTRVVLPTDQKQSRTTAQDTPVASDFLPETLFAQNDLENADAAVIQVWEGTVIERDEAVSSMHVKLHAKIGVIPDHIGEISLEWVAEQDLDLVSPGAVFYLTLYKKRKRGGTIQNSQELRFRRRPSWSRKQITDIDREAESLLAKLHSRPQAE